MPHHNGRYIELVGPPGSGKSTFLRQFMQIEPRAQKIEACALGLLKPTAAFPFHLRYLPEKLAIKALKPQDRQKIIADWLTNNATDADRDTLGILADALTHIASDAPKLAWLKHRQDYIIGAARLAQRSVLQRQSVVVGDESLLQNMVAVFLTRAADQDLSPALASFATVTPKPDAIVSFRAPPEVLWQRLQARPQGMPAVFRDTPKEAYITAAQKIDAGIQSTRTTFEQAGVAWLEVAPEDDFASINAQLGAPTRQ